MASQRVSEQAWARAVFYRFCGSGLGRCHKQYLLSNPTPSAGPVCLKKINDLQNVFLRDFQKSRQRGPSEKASHIP
ncbi:MAG: hypothetical protein Q4G70_15845, partial [Pseudomonadota bacterium]|nr:hypothetical protein [Pseudomonadota bacterium]